MNEAIKMQLSAFVDGELPENEKELLLRRLSQDAGLRQQVAEYLMVGRAMRGEKQIGGVNELRDRVANELGEKPMQDGHVDIAASKNRLLRPLSGIAIAATVALVGILGLQQVTDVDTPEVTPPDAIVDTVDFPTQPEADDILRQYRRIHDAHASDSINARLAAFELRQESTDQDEEPPLAPTDETDQPEVADSDTE
ncbi:MAG: RseA family anti-sigma factor [Gammaproteobacteria bacterium]|nr:RseA family anti-sigma factor [Gammaproteobacteria bacterium]